MSKHILILAPSLATLYSVHPAISLLQGPLQYQHPSSPVSVRFCAFLRWLRALTQYPAEFQQFPSVSQVSQLS